MARLKPLKTTPRPKVSRRSTAGFRDKLTASRKIFVYEWIKEINNGKAKKSPMQAALRAGYSPRTASEQAAHILNDPLVQAEIKKEMKKLEQRTQITAASVLNDIKDIGDRCMQKEPVLDTNGKPTGEWRFDSHGALRSRELLGKSLELFTEKVKQNGEIKINVVVKEENVGKMEKKDG